MILIFSSPVVRRKSERRKRRICCLQIYPSPQMLVGCRSVVLSSSAPPQPRPQPPNFSWQGGQGAAGSRPLTKLGSASSTRFVQHSDKASLFIINESYLSSGLSHLRLRKWYGNVDTIQMSHIWDIIIILLLWLSYPTRDCRRSRHKKEPLPMKLRSLPQSFWQQVNWCLKSC